jgi:hypothetical protein
MASCFLCGGIDESEAWFDGKEYFINLIYDFITQNGIHTIYTLSRNLFDDIVEDAINDVKDGINAKLVRITYEHSPSVTLMIRLNDSDWYGDAISPIEGEVDPMITYQTLYGWMIEHSEYMLTYYIDDSDITINVLKNAKKQNIRIYNLAEHISPEIIPKSNKIIPLKKCTD